MTIEDSMKAKAKEVGTLAEIGAQLGDLVQEAEHEYQEVLSYDPRKSSPWKLKRLSTGEVGDWMGNSDYWRITSRAKPTGPVRTVTRKEIVQGVYGVLQVATHDVPDGQVWIGLSSVCNREELTAAIENLTAIRDALVGNEG